MLAGIDGLRRSFSYRQFLIRFLIIGGVIKAFDIGALDYFLLTKNALLPALLSRNGRLRRLAGLWL
ncbi:MAG: hypothetical protein IJ157_12475 [Clostridia bacterium]|nr:hypothetical protein [Clostridia bacterium]